MVLSFCRILKKAWNGEVIFPTIFSWNIYFGLAIFRVHLLFFLLQGI